MWKTSQFNGFLVTNKKRIWIIFVLKNFISSISFETFLTLSLNYVKFCTKYHCFIWFFSWTFNFNLILVEWEPSVFTFRYLTRLSPIFFRSKATFFIERCKIDFKDVKLWLEMGKLGINLQTSWNAYKSQNEGRINEGRINEEWWRMNEEWWMKNEEGWMRNDEGWWFQAVERFCRQSNRHLWL